MKRWCASPRWGSAARRCRRSARRRGCRSPRAPPDADHAHVISVEGGRVGAVAPAAGAPGTRVVVRDLFFATPARRKFLKSPRIEAEHAEAVVRRLALSAPQVAFRLELDGRVVFEAPAQERIERVAALLGPEAAAVMLPVRDAASGGGPAADQRLYLLAGGVPRDARRGRR